MSNAAGNPRIAEHGKATRFVVGGRNCPVVAQRRALPPWSVRRAVLRIAGATFTIPPDTVGIPSPTRADLRRAVAGSRTRLTVAEIMAVEIWFAAFSGDLSASQKLVMMTDGPAERVTE